MERAIDNEGTRAEKIRHLETLAGFHPAHGDSQVGTQYRGRTSPAGDFPNHVHGVLSEVSPGRRRLAGGVEGVLLFLVLGAKSYSAAGTTFVRPGTCQALPSSSSGKKFAKTLDHMIQHTYAEHG